MTRSGSCVAALLALGWLSAGCGARTSLDTDEVTSSGAGAGGGSTASVGGGGGSDCRIDDLSSWEIERYRDFGDYERAAVATSGVPWVALKNRDGNIVLEKLAIDDLYGIVVTESIDLQDSPVYPVGFDVSQRHFAILTTTGLNWNGDVELWSIDRMTGEIARGPVGDPPANASFTVGSALALLDDEIVVATGRLADDVGVIELRGADLSLRASLTVESTNFTAVHQVEHAVDVYLGPQGRVHVANDTFTQEPVDPSWAVLGGLDDALVQFDATFQLVDGADVYEGPWPHSQISAPAVLRRGGGRVAFSLETELTAVVGYPAGPGQLGWMEIEPSSDASGLGVGLLPVTEEGRLGVLYLGLEIPHPEQPLRYFGRRCR